MNRIRSRCLQEPDTRRLESVLEVAKTTATDAIEKALDHTALVVECTNGCCHSHDNNHRLPSDISRSTFSGEETRDTLELATSSDEPQGAAHGACSSGSSSSGPESAPSTGCGGNGLAADSSESDRTIAVTRKLPRCWPESSRAGYYLDDDRMDLLRIDSCSRRFRRLSRQLCRWMVNDEAEEEVLGERMIDSLGDVSHERSRRSSASDRRIGSAAPTGRRSCRKKVRSHCLWCSRPHTNTSLQPRFNNTDDDGIGNSSKRTVPESASDVSGGRRRFRQQHQHPRNNNRTTNGAFGGNGTASTADCATPSGSHIWPHNGRDRSRRGSGIGSNSSSNTGSRGGGSRRRPHSSGALRNISNNSVVESTYYYEGDIGEGKVRRPVGPAYASAIVSTDTAVGFHLEGTSDSGQQRTTGRDKDSTVHLTQQDYHEDSSTEETLPPSHVMDAGEDRGIDRSVNGVKLVATGRVRKRPEALFCSWDCASRWNDRFSPPQQRHERRIRIDIAAGRIVR